MLTYKNIRLLAQELKKKYETEDVFELCDALKIVVLPESFGLWENSIKGFFFMNRNIKTITYNCDLPDFLREVIVSHEVGHAMLHQGGNIKSFHDVVVFDRVNPMEKEANVFAAEFLISDKKFLRSLRVTRDFFKAAQCLRVPPQLFELKYRQLMSRYNLPEPPIYGDSCFLKYIDTGISEDDEEDIDDDSYDIYPDYDEECDVDYGFDIYIDD